MCYAQLMECKNAAGIALLVPLSPKGYHQGLVIELVNLHRPDGVVNGTELTF
jgi:hypothetical protein